MTLQRLLNKQFIDRNKGFHMELTKENKSPSSQTPMNTSQPSEEAILKALTSDDSSVVRQAAFDASAIQLKVALPTLVALFEHESIGVQEAAEVTIRKIRGKEAVHLLIPYLHSENVGIRNTAMDILREIGSDALSTLCELLHDRTPDIRIFIADILGAIKNPLAVQPLCEALLHDPEINVRNQAAISLGELRQPNAAVALRKALNDEEWVQYAVIEALAKIRDTASIDILLESLTTAPPLVASTILDALGEINNVKAAPNLLAYIEQCDDPLRTKALKSTIQILGPNSLALLEAKQLKNLQNYMLEALNGNNNETINIVLQGLASTGINPEATKAVLTLVGRADSSSYPELLENAYNCLMSIGHNEELEQALTSENALIRKIAIEVCGSLSGKAGRYALKRHFDVLTTEDKEHSFTLLAQTSEEHDIPFFLNHMNIHEDSAILCAGLHFLGVQQKYLNAAPIMLEFLAHPSSQVRECALEACLALEDENTVLRVTSLATHDAPHMRQLAIHAMGHTNAEYFIEELKIAMTDSDEMVRKTAIASIGYGLPSSPLKDDIVQKAMNDSNREVRLNAIEILGEHVHDGNISILLNALTDSDDWVKMRTLDALGAYRITTAVPTIVEMMETSSILVQLKIIETMRAIGNEQAFQALMSFMVSSEPDIQQAAQESLAQLTNSAGDPHE